MGYAKTNTTRQGGASGKKHWLKERLTTMAELRGAKLPSNEALAALASSLSGFSEAVIESVCADFEGRVRGDFESPMPSLGSLMDACRKESYIAAESPKWGVWICESCKNGLASKEGTPKGGCPNCGHGVLKMRVKPEQRFDHEAYMRDVHRNPQDYVKVSDVIRECAATRQKQGKFVDLALLAAISSSERT